MGKVFGRKVSRGFHTFAKKADQGIKTLGKKGGVLDLAERKLFNTIDAVAPMAAMAADMYAPGSGKAILAANDGAQELHKNIRRGVKQVQAIKAADTKEGRKQAIVNFGDNIDQVKQSVNQSAQLLRDAKTAVTSPAVAAVAAAESAPLV